MGSKNENSNGVPQFFNGAIIYEIERTVYEIVSTTVTTTTTFAHSGHEAKPPGSTQARPSSAATADLTVERVRSVYGQDISCICGQFNTLLKDNPLATDYLPVSETSIFLGMYDGLLLCAMANLLKSDSIDANSVATRSDLSDCDEEAAELLRMQNRNLAFAVLQPLGVAVDAAGMQKNLMEGCLFALTSVLVQVLRLATLGRMNFKDNELLVHLFNGWSNPEEARAILAISREKMLLRWVTYQLIKRAGMDRALLDLGTDLADSSIYATLLWTVAPVPKQGTLATIADTLEPDDYVSRAERVISSAQKLDITGVITPQHIANAGKEGSRISCLHGRSLNAAFLYRIFAAYPNVIIIPEQRSSPASSSDAHGPTPEQMKSWSKRGASEEMLIRWLNSFGPSDPVQNIETDLRDGSVLLQVWDAIIPGCVDWTQVKFDVQGAAKLKFTWMANCEAVLTCAISVGIPRNCCSPAGIVAGETQNILSLVFQMMLIHSQLSRKRVIGKGVKVPDIDDNGLVQWFNTKIRTFGSSFQLKGFGDPRLKSTNALGFLGERLLVEMRLCFTGSAGFLLKQRGSGAEKPPAPGRKSSQQSPPPTPTPSPPPPPPTPPPPPLSTLPLRLPPTPPPPPLSTLPRLPPTPTPPPPPPPTPPPPPLSTLPRLPPTPTPPPPPPPPPPLKSPQQKSPLPGTGNTSLVPTNQTTEGSLQQQEKQKEQSRLEGSGASNTALALPSNQATGGGAGQQKQQQQGQKGSSTGNKEKPTGRAGRSSGTGSFTSFTSSSSRTEERYSKSTTKTSVNVTTWSTGNRNAVDVAKEGEADDRTMAAQPPEGAHNAATEAVWLFDSVSPLSGEEEFSKFSVTAILMLNKAGIVVYANRLGPDTDSAVYRNILLELNALSMKEG